MIHFWIPTESESQPLSELYGNFTVSFNVSFSLALVSSLCFHCISRKRYISRIYIYGMDEQWNVSSKHEIKIEWLFALKTLKTAEKERDRERESRRKNTMEQKARSQRRCQNATH